MILIVTLITLNGCATMEIPAYVSQSTNNYPEHDVKDGLVVAVHPLTDKKEMKKYFGFDLIKANILAIFIKAENQTADQSFLITKDKVIVGQAQANMKNDVVSEAPGETGIIAGSGALIILPIAALPLLMVGGKMKSDATAIKHNFAIKEFRSHTVSPGESKEGFIYFKLPKERDGSESWVVKIEAKKLGSKGRVKFVFNINLKGDQ